MARIIKRYENRKLYDTEERKYISLEEIATLVRQGVDVRIIDKNTENDITAQTLTQVIFEEGKKGRNPLSTEMLHDVLRWGNHVIDDSIHKVKEGIDQLIPESLQKLFNKPEPKEIDELKKRIESLESIINRLSDLQLDDNSGSSQTKESKK